MNIVLFITIGFTIFSFWRLNEAEMDLKGKALKVESEDLIKAYLAYIDQIKILLSKKPETSNLYEPELDSTINKVHQARKQCGVAILTLVCTVIAKNYL